MITLRPKEEAPTNEIVWLWIESKMSGQYWILAKLAKDGWRGVEGWIYKSEVTLDDLKLELLGWIPLEQPESPDE